MSHLFSRPKAVAALLVISLASLSHDSRADFVLQRLCSFGSTSAPPSALLQALDGNFYGATPALTSLNRWGTVFRMTPDGACSNLFTFNNGLNGGDPVGEMVLGDDGNIYGATASGGRYGYGTIFRLTTEGALSTVVSFNGANGIQPGYGLTRDNAGLMYGVTLWGGANGEGTIFRVTTNGLLTTLFSFSRTLDPERSIPIDCPIMAADGFLYGTTIPDTSTIIYPIAFTIYKLSVNGAFVPFMDGRIAGPRGGLRPGADGHLYGVTISTDPRTGGCIFRIDSNATFTALCPFAYTNGYPWRLFQAADGFLYGASKAVYGRWGTIFRVSTDGEYTTIVNFNGSNGTGCAAPLIQANDGVLYGTATAQAPLSGTICRLVEPPSISAIVASGNTLALTWTSFANAAYRVESKASLADSWTTLRSNIIATGPVTSVTTSAQGFDRGIYRVVLLP